MLKIPLLVSLGHHGGRRKVASLRPPFSTPLRSLGEPDPETPFLVPIEHAPPLFVRIREDKISLKISPAPLPRSCQLAKSRKTAILAVFPHFNGFLGKIERNGARGSIPTAILHRKRYVWVTLLNFYFLPTAPNKKKNTDTEFNENRGPRRRSATRENMKS